MLENVNHLLEDRWVRINHVIRQQYSERLVSDQFTRGERSMAESEGFFLADVGDVNHVRNRAHDLQQVEFLTLFQHFFQLVADVKMVLNGLLATAGDDDDLVASRGHGLFHAILNNGFVHQWEHFFRLRFGGGQKAGAQSGGRKYGFAYSHSYGIQIG